MPESTATDADLFALAREALLEITRDDTLGEPRDVTTEDDGSKTVRFENTLPGYPGWLWTVSVSSVDGHEPTVLETELLPGDGSLLAPDWVPWVERLAEYEAQQALEHGEAGEGESSDDDDSDEDEDDDDLDDDDSDEDDDDLDEDDSDDDDDESDDYADVDDDDIALDDADLDDGVELDDEDDSSDDDEAPEKH